MKQIIAGKLYDSEKAELVLEFSRPIEMRNVFQPYTELASGQLYQTKKGAWFEIVGQSTSGEQFNVITEKKAKELIGITDPDLYLKIFDGVQDA